MQKKITDYIENKEGNNFKQTEIRLIPEDWEVVRLGEVCQVDWGNTSLTKRIYMAQGYPAYSATGQDGFLDFYEHEGEAIILSAIGARCGKCFFAFGKWTAIKNTIVIKNKDEAQVDLLFLYFFVNDEDYWHRSGTGQPFIGINLAKKQYVPLPPFPEQKKIARVLSKIQQAMEQQDKIIEATKNLKKSLMQKLFTEGLGHKEFKETEIGEIPKIWGVVRLGEIAKVKYGKANPKTKGIIPLVGSSGIYGMVNKPLINFPTLVVGRKGTAGEVYLFLNPCYPSDTTFYLKFYQNNLDLTYLFYYMQLNKLSGEHAKTTLPSLQKGDLENYKFPFPPFSEQQQITHILNVVDKKIEVEERRKRILKELFKTMLYKLMTGEIRLKDIEV